MFGFFKKLTTGQAKQPDNGMREFIKGCNVYCNPETNQVIVTSVYNHGGLMAEKPDGASVASLSNSAALDTVIRTALDSCEYEGKLNYSNQKKSDWPAYRASGYKSAKRFEAEFIRLHVRGVNEKNFYYEVTSPEFGEFGLHLTITVNAHNGNHGEAVQCMVKNYLACKAVTEVTL